MDVMTTRTSMIMVGALDFSQLPREDRTYDFVGAELVKKA